MTQKIKSTEQIEDILDIKPSDVVKYHSDGLVEMVEKEILDSTPNEDLEFARKSIREMIIVAGESLETLVNIANSAEDSKSFEALASNLRVYNDMCGNLAKLSNIQNSEKKQNKEQSSETTNIQNNIVFSGSSEDLLKQIKKLNGN